MSAEIPESRVGDPIWELATLFPAQGAWSESEYLGLKTNRLIELSNGELEFLSVPTELHQLIAFYFCTLLRQHSEVREQGLALMAPFRVRVSANKFREPDVIFMLHENRERRHPQYWDGADLVVEVVSEDDPNRDLQTKRTEYAEARIAEYWIVDPRDSSVRVLTLDPDATEYREVGCYTSGQIASSVLLNDFKVSVEDVFDQEEPY